MRTALTDGTHHIVASAPGRVTIDKTFDVSPTAAAFSLVLERAKRTTPLPTGHGSGSAKTTDKDAPIDPFKD